jgi:hypothetical protein
MAIPLSPLEQASPSDSLTVIITTSVTPSAPSTELLSSVLQSFHDHCPALLRARVIVVFDGYDRVASQARLKKGQVTPELARDWDLYKANVKELILQHFVGVKETAPLARSTGEAEYGSHHIANNVVAFTTMQTRDNRVAFIEPERRLGFGLAVRTALRLTKTPYVWLQQHDWNLVADIPVEHIVQVMKDSEPDHRVPIKYVCLPAVRMLSYAVSSDVQLFPVLKELTAMHQRQFIPSSRPNVSVPLTPLFFWHDKPHIASTEHYLARVFPSRLAMLRGDFVEDKIGQRARSQMKEGTWSKWATWLYYPDEGKQLCLRHLKGRTWRGTDAQAKQVALYRERNLEKLDGDKAAQLNIGQSAEETLQPPT